MSDLLEQKLHVLHQQNQPDSTFADQLERELRTVYEQSLPGKPSRLINLSGVFRRLAAIAAVFIILIGLFATVPSLQNLAQRIIDYFVPGDSYTLPQDEHAYDDIVSVDSIADAETIAGFDALEYVDGGFNILHISAAQGLISIAYERENDRGVLMHVSKWRTGTRPEQRPISPDAEVLPATVNGLEAQFVAGYWFGTEDPVWEEDHYRQLRWQDDEFSYSLLVARPFARTVDQVVRVAEALR